MIEIRDFRVIHDYEILKVGQPVKFEVTVTECTWNSNKDLFETWESLKINFTSWLDLKNQ